MGCWAGPVDGVLGPRTEAALREFQEAEGITVTGLFGGESQGALIAAAQAGQPVCGDPEADATAGPTPVDEAAVHELEVWQHDLNVVGCYAGAEDGTLGPQTEAAIRAFQSATRPCGRRRPRPGHRVGAGRGGRSRSPGVHLAGRRRRRWQRERWRHARRTWSTPPTRSTPPASGPPGPRPRPTWRASRRSGISGFGVIEAAGGFIVLQSGLSQTEANQLLIGLNQNGFSGRIVAGV